jgi:NAD(P) transhydrogenase subunit alpha
MRIVVPREHAPLEKRVAMTPAAIERFSIEGTSFVVESGAGVSASFSDEEYREAGAEVIEDAQALFEGADVVLKVNGPTQREDGVDEADLIPSGALVVGMLRPHESADLLARLAERGVTALAMELMPRTTQAQRMDALSAFSTIAGYSAVLRGADSLGKFFPMLTTAAGTIPPANVLIIGAGVAGLQAIATARRLGSVVEAFDIRPAVKEQVESLGATFVEWEEAQEELETEGGYAKEVSEEEQERERRLISDHVAKSDVVVTTALVPGRAAPVLITEDMVKRMRPGSVIVDLASEAGGNCELTVKGETVERHGVIIQGPLDLATSLPVHGSLMYGRILTALLKHLTKDGELVVDLKDEITSACAVTHGGNVRYER